MEGPPEKPPQTEKCGIEIDKRLGKGAFGAVYAVHETGNKTVYALKYFEKLPNQAFGFDLNGEIDVLFRLNHPHLLHGIKLLSEHVCPIENFSILMPIGKYTVRDMIRYKMINASNRADLMFKLATGLNFLHRNNILHCDLKPENMILDENDNPKIIDFGASVLLYEESIDILYPRTTVIYEAPENLRWPIYHYSRASDVWSLGICFVEMIKVSEIYPHLVDYSRGSVAKEVTAIFAPEVRHEKLAELFSGIDPSQLEVYIDLISGMNSINPNRRLTMEQVLGHFSSKGIPQNIPGITVIPAQIKIALPPTFREYLKALVNKLIADLDYKECNIAVLFLAVDLLFRCADLETNTAMVAACIQTSLLMYGINFKIDKFEIKAEDIINSQLKIVHHLKGVIYRPFLYESATNLYQITKVIHAVILHRTEYIHYLVLDVPSFYKMIGTGNDTRSKLVTISERLQAP